MKKVYSCGLSLLCASLGAPQVASAASTTSYNPPISVTATSGCSLSGVTGSSVDASGNISFIGGTPSAGCSGSVTSSTGSSISWTTATSLSFAAGSTPSAPITYTWTSADTAATCAVTDSSPATGITKSADGHSFTVPSLPAAQGTYTYGVTCTTPSNTSPVAGSPATLTLNVTSTTTTPPPTTTGCASNQLSTPWGLTRQCAGTVTYQYGAPVAGATFTSAYPLQNLADVLGGGTWANYAGMQWAWWIPVTTGSYISVAFTPTTSTALNVNANPTYGAGGVVSISTRPGVFDSTAICVAANGGNNNLSIGGYNCPVTVGQTYYFNIADVTTSGTPHCWGYKVTAPQTCASSTVSYTAN